MSKIMNMIHGHYADTVIKISNNVYLTFKN